VLGEGAFGIVRKAVLHTGEKRRDVAVKMLRGINRNCSEVCQTTVFGLDTITSRLLEKKCILTPHWEAFLKVLEKIFGIASLNMLRKLSASNFFN
jgi:hypothetical protein